MPSPLHESLLAEGRVALTLTRSSRGSVRLKVCSHSTGTFLLDLSGDDFSDLLFGVAETLAKVSRVTPGVPSYPRGDLPETDAPKPVTMKASPICRKCGETAILGPDGWTCPGSKVMILTNPGRLMCEGDVEFALPSSGENLHAGTP